MLASLALALLPFSIQGTLSDRLDKILDVPAFKGALAGVCVMKEDGTILYGRNAETRIVPASNQKLLSVSFALHTLGPEWRPVTKFWKLSDRIVVDCPGDPSMTYAKLKDAAQKLGAKADTPIYVRQGYRAGVPPTWEHDDLPHRYAPRITAFTVDRGSFTLAAENGSPKLLPDSYGVRIMHFAGGTVRTDFDPFGNLMVVHGDMPKENRNLENFAIPEPDRAAASILGGRLFEATSVPERSPDLAIEGDSIGDMAKACLPPSDNYLAESLMLLAASKQVDLSDAPYSKGPARMREFLVKTVGLAANDVRPYDGSGMSRHNFVTPLGIAKLLAWARRQRWGRLWEEAMAYPGKPGTLSSRLQGTSFRGKTGSLNSVASLSGYVKAGNGETWVVVTIINHFISPAAEVRAVADSFVKELEKPVTLASILVPGGLHLEGRIRHESDRPIPWDPASDGDWLLGPLHDRLAAFAGQDRRAQPHHAAAHRAKRMALRLR